MLRRRSARAPGAPGSRRGRSGSGRCPRGRGRARQRVASPPRGQRPRRQQAGLAPAGGGSDEGEPPTAGPRTGHSEDPGGARGPGRPGPAPSSGSGTASGQRRWHPHHASADRPFLDGSERSRPATAGRDPRTRPPSVVEAQSVTTAFSTSTLAAERAGPRAASTPATAASATYTAICGDGDRDRRDALVLQRLRQRQPDADPERGAAQRRRSARSPPTPSGPSPAPGRGSCRPHGAARAHGCARTPTAPGC